MYSRLSSFLTAWTRRERFENSLDEEVRFHLDAYTEDSGPLRGLQAGSGSPRPDPLRQRRRHEGRLPAGARAAARRRYGHACSRHQVGVSRSAPQPRVCRGDPADGGPRRRGHGRCLFGHPWRSAASAPIRGVRASGPGMGGTSRCERAVQRGRPQRPDVSRLVDVIREPGSDSAPTTPTSST